MELGQINQMVKTASTSVERRAIDALRAAFDQEMSNHTNPVVFRKQLAGKEVELRLDDLNQTVKSEIVKLRDSSEKLEGLIMKQMLDVMAKSVPKGQFDGPMGDLGKDMLNDALAGDLTRSRKGGLADLVFKQFSESILTQQLVKKEQGTTP